MLTALFPVLPDVGLLKADLYLWAAAFAGVLVAIFAFAKAFHVVTGELTDEEVDEDEPEDQDDDRDL